jgi:hypothetical protein
MNTRITLLSDDTLDVVTGGMMYDGRANVYKKLPNPGGDGNGFLSLLEGIVGVAVAATKDGLLFGPLGTLA